MKGKKEALWAVVISAAFVAAGFILSCGDEDGNGGGAAVDCQAACEKLAECDQIPGMFYIFGETVKECMDVCEDELAGGGGEDFAEMYECVTDTSCDDILIDCFWQVYCEKLDDCGISYWYTVDDCVDFCASYYYEYLFPSLCSMGYSSCELIWYWCMPMP